MTGEQRLQSPDVLELLEDVDDSTASRTGTNPVDVDQVGLELSDQLWEHAEEPRFAELTAVDGEIKFSGASELSARALLLTIAKLSLRLVSSGSPSVRDTERNAWSSGTGSRVELGASSRPLATHSESTSPKANDVDKLPVIVRSPVIV